MKRFAIIIGVILFLYLLGPLVAGIGGIGDRSGPVIYPESYHSEIYQLGYELVRGEKPRLGMDSILYNRPIFYGFNRAPKIKSERDIIIEKLKDSPMGEIVKDSNEKIIDQ